MHLFIANCLTLNDAGFEYATCDIWLVVKIDEKLIEQKP